MIHLSNQSLWDVNAGWIVNPVNLEGVMGKGIALVMRESFPHMYEAYRQACDDRSLKPGYIGLWGDPFQDDTRNDPVIVNLPTKTDWRRESDLRLIGEGLASLDKLLDRHNIGIRNNVVAMPRIGCGAGGLKWEVVEPLVRNLNRDYDIIVCDGFLEPRLDMRKRTWSVHRY